MSENVVGNAYDKYGSSNPIARALMRGFLREVGALYRAKAPETVLEVGGGEGHLAQFLVSQHQPSRFVMSDLSLARVPASLDPRIETAEASAYALPWADDEFDLVVCCEVLEHLEDPARGLSEVARVARRGVLISTPWEPVWRAMNVMRGRYLGQWGNTPGHVQHFGRADLVTLARTQLDHLSIRRPLPWTVIMGEPR
jgi:ubiquinone/menaquinone biosynthesis C-methylase UbiE